MRISGVRSRLVEFPLDAPFRPAWGRGRVQSTLVLGEFTISSLLNYNTLQVAGPKWASVTRRCPSRCRSQPSPSASSCSSW